ncbi:DUF1254 domain-containing protein [Bdellovibrio sp. HCB337]|uniref:DUF1254 domain-containing protein n=1 Tax=Bdellovibrio sp. HCB337 TaxID=3394358 RepID=UPI0039A56DEF
MKYFGLFFLTAAFALGLSSCNRQARQQAQLDQLARDAFSFGYPLVLMDTAGKYVAATSRSSPQQSKLPMYQFYHTRKTGDARFKDLASLDNDMIYSYAWLNLANDPVVLSIPAIASHKYYVGGFIQGWTEIFGVVGTRVNGNEKQTYLISGPQWRGSTPKGMKPLRSSTNLVWLPIRLYANAGKDVQALRNFQDGLRVTPLSQWGKSARAATTVNVDTTLDLKQQPRDLVFNMNAETYYRTLCALMVDNPPSEIDTPLMERLSKLNIIPTKNFKFSDLPAETQAALNTSIRNARSYILTHRGSFTPRGRLVNGWTVSVERTEFGVDYERRAYEAYMGLGFLPPQDAIFPVAYEDNMGQQLMGENSYKVTFKKDQLPPVNAFWSLTMYQLPDIAFAGNRYRRYTIGQYSSLKTNPDGSITIYMQPTSPGKDKESNWLPSKPGNYQLTLKMYWPKQEVLEARWLPPAVERVQQSRMASY